jgi:hypothetical protein
VKLGNIGPEVIAARTRRPAPKGIGLLSQDNPGPQFSRPYGGHQPGYPAAHNQDIRFNRFSNHRTPLGKRIRICRTDSISRNILNQSARFIN